MTVITFGVKENSIVAVRGTGCSLGVTVIAPMIACFERRDGFAGTARIRPAPGHDCKMNLAHFSEFGGGGARRGPKTEGHNGCRVTCRVVRVAFWSLVHRPISAL